MRTRSYFSPDLFSRGSAGDAARLTASEPVRPPRVTPALAPRDETIFWLTAAAEVEQFLMVHYLFAAYSLWPQQGGEQESAAQDLQDTLRQIAREEMGHLITVQNLLTLLGAPLHFGREHSPYASEIYPFRFKLERVSLGSLAKYAMAESPLDRKALEQGLTANDLKLYDTEIGPKAVASNAGRPVRHVGPIFARLRELFANELTAHDMRLDRASRQAEWGDWGYRTHPRHTETPDLRVLVHRFEQDDFEAARDAAVAAIEEIGEQGEAADKGIGDGESHFERFLFAYKQLAGIEATGPSPVLPVLTNPNVTLGSTTGTEPSAMMEMMQEAVLEEGRIVDPRSRAWAQLFNLRYRLLLRYLHHALLLEGPVYFHGSSNLGDRTAKGLLVAWTFNEMRRLGKIARKLVRMPSGQNRPALNAGPPFELPYSLVLSADDADRWAGHADVLRAARSLAIKIASAAPDDNDAFLQFVMAEDTRVADLADRFATGSASPTDGQPVAFAKAAAILDEAVRGFSIGEHGSFWRDRTREAFLAQDVYGQPSVTPGEPENSPLLSRLVLPEDDVNRMPRYRPRIDQTRIDYLRHWIAEGAKDNVPAGAIGIGSEPDPAPEAAPAPPPVDGSPGFASDIKPLFRSHPDRVSMQFLFDLHDYTDVKAHADAILASLESGRMPCTMPWPPERIELFRAWMRAGYPA